MSTRLDIYTDGACSGNPGEASIGFVINKDKQRIKEFSKTIGQATNNIAEYTALIYALQEALILKADTVRVYTDSELMHRQITGRYKVKNENIKQLFDQVKNLIKGFKEVQFNHVPREQNKDADQLASSALKKRQAEMVAPTSRHE